AAGEHQARIGQDVGDDDPTNVRKLQLKGSGNAGEGDVDRGVEGRQQGAKGDEEQSGLWPRRARHGATFCYEPLRFAGMRDPSSIGANRGRILANVASAKIQGAAGCCWPRVSGASSAKAPPISNSRIAAATSATRGP